LGAGAGGDEPSIAVQFSDEHKLENLVALGRILLHMN
jgi:hypothetical protein